MPDDYFIQVISPVLFLFNVDIIGMFKYYGEHMWRFRDVDILINYNYQEIFYDLVWEYANPRFIEKCKKEIDISVSEKEIVDQMMGSPYRDYFMYYLYRSRLERVPFEEWLEQEHDFTFWRIKQPNFVYDISRNYQTIIALDSPYYRPMFNQFNYYYNQAPNCINPEDLVDKAVYYLLQGGKFVLDKPYDDKVIYMHEDLEFAHFPHIMKKKKTKKETKLIDKVGFL